MRFIGHLDLMRFFQKAIRRADIPIRYSEGMSPHMIMSFASPLGVGLTSSGEYVDIELTEPVPTKEALSRLNAQMAGEMTILDFLQVEEGKAGKAMSLVAAADYTVRFREGCAPSHNWPETFESFLAQETIEVLKESKKGEKLVNIRPMIIEVNPGSDSVLMRLASGSEANLKPELVMKAWGRWSHVSLTESALLINREELYADQGTETEHRYIPLSDLGEEIPPCPVLM